MMWRARRHALSRSCVAATTLLVAAQSVLPAAVEEVALRELEALRARVPSFRVLSLATTAGEVTIRPEQSLTIEDLRGVDLDVDPPVLGSPTKPYDRRMADTFAPGTAPYVAPGSSRSA